MTIILDPAPIDTPMHPGSNELLNSVWAQWFEVRRTQLLKYLSAASTPSTTNTGGAGKLNVVSKTANFTATSANDVIFCDCTGGNFTITLYAANALSAGFTKPLWVKRIDSSANTVTIAAAGGDTIDGAANFVLGALQGVPCVSDSVSKWGVC